MHRAKQNNRTKEVMIQDMTSLTKTMIFQSKRNNSNNLKLHNPHIMWTHPVILLASIITNRKMWISN